MNQTLRRARKQRLWSQVEVAEKAEVSERTYMRWEAGTQTPRDYNLKLLCDAFGMSPSELGFERETYVEVVKTSLMVPGDEDMDRMRRLLLQGAATMMVAPQFIDPDISKRLSMASAKPLIDEKALMGFDDATGACWNLSNGNELEIAEQILPTYLGKLVKIAKHPSKQQQRAASLVSESLQLQSILAAHKLNFVAKEAYCLQAIEYAKLAMDRNAQASAMVQLAVAYYYNQRPAKALEVYEEALLYVSQLSPLMQSRIYMGAAEAYGKNGRVQEALRYIGLAYAAFPNTPETDPSYRYADFGLFALLEHDGLIHLTVEQPQRALDVFDQVEKHHNDFPIPERIRLEMVNYQAEAALMSNDQERFVTYLEEGVDGAMAIRSQKRLDEVSRIFSQKLPASWRQSPRVKSVMEKHGL